MLRWYNSTLVQQYTKTLVNKFTGTLAHWHTGTLVKWYNSTMLHYYPAALAHYCGTISLIHCAARIDCATLTTVAFSARIARQLPAASDKMTSKAQRGGSGGPHRQRRGGGKGDLRGGDNAPASHR
eukprot:3153401-Pyramimonas_sp.AAC.1